MAFPFKTGGDFYNCEAQRMRLHNLGANPTETATGLMYFNTGASNLGKHAVVHDGTKFKALAFVDEIATNTAFTELADRVLTIEKALGEDTANVIDTWEEIQNFLKDINENDANLMTMLNSKLDKSGGTMTGNIGYRVPLNQYWASGIVYKDSSDSALAQIGAYSNNSSTIDRIYLGFGTGVWNGENALVIERDKISFNKNTLLHEGNIGEYALKTDGSNNMKGGISWGKSTSPTWNVFSLDAGKGIQILNTVGSSSEGAISDYAVGLAVSGYYGFCLGYDALNKRAVFKSSQSEFGEKWKTIAFTDSVLLLDGSNEMTGDLKLKESSVYWHRDKDNYCIATEIHTDKSPSLKIAHYGGINFHTAGALKMLINQAGNVTIGGSDLAGTNAKLYVDGRVYSKSAFLFDGYYGIWKGRQYTGSLLETDIAYNATKHYFTGGNVLIGTPNEIKSGAKLQIKGDVYVDGNIIATKEVSAGGAGQEGESGDGGAEVIDKELAKGQSSYTIPNTIGRSAVAVSLYEWNANNSSWDMCLADISVKDATITVTFGSATSVNHKLVAVG